MKRIVINDSDQKIHIDDIAKIDSKNAEMISFHPSELSKTHYYDYCGPLVVGGQAKDKECK